MLSARHCAEWLSRIPDTATSDRERRSNRGVELSRLGAGAAAGNWQNLARSRASAALRRPSERASERPRAVGGQASSRAVPEPRWRDHCGGGPDAEAQAHCPRSLPSTSSSRTTAYDVRGPEYPSSSVVRGLFRHGPPSDHRSPGIRTEEEDSHRRAAKVRCVGAHPPFVASSPWEKPN